jgi:hypothetical protein
MDFGRRRSPGPERLRTGFARVFVYIVHGMVPLVALVSKSSPVRVDRRTPESNLTETSDARPCRARGAHDRVPRRDGLRPSRSPDDLRA